MKVILACVLILAGCASGQSEEPLREGKPQRVVSLNPCTDALAAELAGPGQLVAISHFSLDPAASSMDVRVARQFRATGGTVEEVLALDPDLVVAGSFMPPATRRALERLGIRVETFGIASSVGQSQDQVRQMAALLGHEQAGEALARRIGSAVAASRPVGGEPRLSAVLWQPGGIVPGEATLIGELMREAGLASHSAALGMAQADYLPLEVLLADPPQLLLVAGDSRAQHHPALGRLAGMRRAAFDPSLLYCGGPTIVSAAERLSAIRAGER